jgi:16S rRNA U516 pseudouridylate synthase RsuA-like enzyme
MGNRVVHLNRIRVADLKLGRLAKGLLAVSDPGEIRRLLKLKLT